VFESVFKVTLVLKKPRKYGVKLLIGGAEEN